MTYRLLVILLILKAIAFMFFIHSGSIGLGPDEAQYWTWSQDLSPGYYSKPPGIAWEIWMGTKLFGNTELGVRAGACLLGLLLPLAVYRLAKVASDSEKAAFLAGLTMAFIPLGMLASFLAITDTGMTVFWVLACHVIICALKKNEEPNYLIVGSFIALGALFKWPIYFLWIVIALFYRSLKGKHLVLGIGISFLGFLPSLIWNINHDFATIRHVLATVLGQQVEKAQTSFGFNPNFPEFVGSQILLLSPIVFVLFVIAMIQCFRTTQPKHLKFLAIFCLAPLAVCISLSLVKKIQGNWASYAYPTGIVLTAIFILNWKRGVQWLLGGLALSILLTTFALSIPALERAGVNIPYKFNPFRHNMGWNDLGLALEQEGYNPEKDFLFSDKYQMTSLLSFYGKEQKRAYFFNIHGVRKNQFSYWPSMVDSQIGKDGYFVLAENSPHLEKFTEVQIKSLQNELKNYFESVEFKQIKPLFYVNKKLVKGAFIFSCKNYQGNAPKELEIY